MMKNELKPLKCQIRIQYQKRQQVFLKLSRLTSANSMMFKISGRKPMIPFHQTDLGHVTINIRKTLVSKFLTLRVSFQQAFTPVDGRCSPSLDMFRLHLDFFTCQIRCKKLQSLKTQSKLRKFDSCTIAISDPFQQHGMITNGGRLNHREGLFFFLNHFKISSLRKTIRRGTCQPR